MKLRIVKDGNEKYIVQEKSGFFSKWQPRGHHDKLESAREHLDYRLSILKDLKKNKILEKQLTLIEQYNLKDI